MKIITEPTVHVLGRLEMNYAALGEFLAAHGLTWQSEGPESYAEELVETAGRLCYMSFSKPRPGGNAAYLKHILEVGHGSVIEHAVWNLLVTGISRSCSHELVRHRIGVSPSQLSQRYVDESAAEYVVPVELEEEVAAARFWDEYDGMGPVPERWRKYCDANGSLAADFFTPMDAGRKWLYAVGQSHGVYVSLADYLDKKVRQAAYRAYCQAKKDEGLGAHTMDEDKWWREDGRHRATEFRKAARQAARSVLPNATETKLFLTFNARALRNFFELRASRHAEPEIRKLANRVYEKLLPEAPHLFGDYKKEALPDGTYELTTPHRKV